MSNIGQKFFEKSKGGTIPFFEKKISGKSKGGSIPFFEKKNFSAKGGVHYQNSSV
jgi:hypothetical protein